MHRLALIRRGTMSWVGISYVVRRTSYVLTAGSLLAFTPQDPAVKIWQMPGAEGGAPRIQIMQNMERLDPPKLSPKHKWVFEWVCSGLGRTSEAENQFNLRIRVFAQQQKSLNDPGPLVARMAMRLWDYNVRKLNMPHKEMYDHGRVHFYLCFGGEAGGEQLFDEDEEAGIAKRVNTIYIYQIQNIKNPVELAREVAHEYGHATLPPVGGFKEPEDWANGYLGEKLYMSYLRDELKAKRLGTDDAMGATAEQLDAFVKREIDPLAARVALNGPDMSQLVGTGPAAMNAYLGLALYANDILQPRAFARSLLLTGSTNAQDYPAAIILALSELETYVVPQPAYTEGKDFWIPIGKGKLASGATEIKRSGDWALVRPLAGAIRINNPK